MRGVKSSSYEKGCRFLRQQRNGFPGYFWRGRVRIELTQDALAPNTGFEDQEAHQLPFHPQKYRSLLYHCRYIKSILRELYREFL